MLLNKIFTRDVTANDPALKAMLASWGGESIAGANITPENSLKISGWYAGVKILSECVASLPLLTYRRTGEQGKERARNHPVYRLLREKPNEYMTPFELIETSMAHLICWGNAFSIISRDGRGAVTSLWPIAPSRVRMQLTADRIWYYYSNPEGREVQIAQDNMLHLRGLASDGLIGYSPVDLMREALGLAKIEEEYRARFFKNDARPSAVVEYPGKLSEPAYQRFKNDWQATYAGMANSHKIGFLEQGLKWHDVGFPPETAQFIEGRKFQLEEIARILGIPLILMQSTEKATSWGTGIEQFLIAFMRFTIRPWLRRWESRLNTMLFTPEEQRAFFCEFLAEDLLRADSLTRAQVLQILRRNGIVNADEWRAMENLNPLPDEQGQKYIIEGNMTTLEKVGQDDPAEEPDDDEPVGMNGNGNGNGRSLLFRP
jgi:HK97 family phage portal protein